MQITTMRFRKVWQMKFYQNNISQTLQISIAVSISLFSRVTAVNVMHEGSLHYLMPSLCVLSYHYDVVAL